MEGKEIMKTVTFSYDDGVTQDQRLIDLFDKYGVSEYLIDNFDDNMVRYFVPEVNSSEEDLQSIINDLLKYDIKFQLED